MSDRGVSPLAAICALAALAGAMAGCQTPALRCSPSLAASLSAKATLLDAQPVDLGKGHCGESAVETLLAFHLNGYVPPASVDPPGSAAVKSVSTLEMLLTFRRAGLGSELGVIATEQVLAELAAGRPVVIVVGDGDGGKSTGDDGVKHCWVIRGYDPATARFIINTPERGPCSIGREELEKRWVGAGSIAIRVRPK